MIDVEGYLQEFYDENGLTESKRRLANFYHAFLKLYDEYLPDVAKSATEVGARFRSGCATKEEVASAREACWNWMNSHGGVGNTSASYFALRAAIIAESGGDSVSNDEELLHDLSMFLYCANQAADHSADVERYLRASFEST